MQVFLKRMLLVFSVVGLLALVACGGDNEQVTEDEAEHATENGSDSENYSEAVNYTITGIEPGAGISVTTEKAIEEYENLEGWDVDLSSTAAMMAELEKAIDNEEPIIVTGWNPHWMFAKFPDLKYLDDPLNIYGGDEDINTLTRIGFEEDNPEAFKVLDQFAWDVEDMEAIMYEANETGEEVEDVAKHWVEDNMDKVESWIDGVEDVDGVAVEIVSTPWDSERASSAVLKEAMEMKGFDVTVTPVDVAVVFESVATGDADATVAAWLPGTHAEFYEKHKDDLVDLGPNLTGTRIGLTVPAYMDIDSIEDLEPNN